MKEFDELLSQEPPPPLSSPSSPDAMSGKKKGPKFVHVIRDGRDIAFGDLRLITSVMCAAFFEGYAERFDSAKVIQK